MKPYADTNFFTRIYLPVPESAQAREILRKARENDASALPVTALHRLELVNAFQLHVFQGREMGQPRITPEQAASALASFFDDLSDRKFLQASRIELSAIESQFESLAHRHTRRHGFRTYDLIHVTFAALLKCDTFWSFDRKARQLATLEGLDLSPAMQK